MKLTRRTLTLTATVAALVSTLGWSSSAQAQAVPKEVRIGWQKGSPILVLARKQQVIEKRLKTLGIESVKWIEFQFGPPLLEALGAGAVDLGVVGDTPPIFAQAGGSNLVYAAASPTGQSAILVPKNSPIKTLADLKGKKVAFSKGSSAHHVTIKALALAGLTIKDITPTYLSPADATAAFNGGNVDAWTVWDPYYAIAETRYEARVIADTSDKRLESASYYVAHRDFATQYPSVLSAVLDEIRLLTVKAGQNREELAAVAAEATGIDVKAWLIAFKRAEFSLGPVTDAHIAQQQQLADSFYSLGIVPKKINVQEIVWHAPK